MTRYYRRKETGRKEDLAAGLVAAGVATTVAAISYYLVRIFLSREPLGPIETAGSKAEKVLSEASEEIEG